MTPVMLYVGFLATILTIVITTINIKDSMHRGQEDSVERVLDKWGLIDMQEEPRTQYPNGSRTLQSSLRVIYENTKRNRRILDDHLGRDED